MHVLVFTAEKILVGLRILIAVCFQSAFSGLSCFSLFKAGTLNQGSFSIDSCSEFMGQRTQDQNEHTSLLLKLMV